MIIQKIAIGLKRLTVINRMVLVLNSGCLVGILFLGHLPHIFALLFILGWAFTLLFTALWGLACFLRRVDVLCPNCSSKVFVEPGRGFVCPDCGPVKCRG